MEFKKYKGGRYWAVYDEADRLIVVCVYKKGAAEVVRRLDRQEPSPTPGTGNAPTTPLPDTIQ